MKRIAFFTICLVHLTCYLGIEAFAGVVTTRVTGAANWSSNTTWIQNRTGTITSSTLSSTVTGVGTAFDTELSTGDQLVLQTAPGTVIGTIATIQNATQLTLTANAGSNAAGQSYGREAVPASSDDVFIGNPALAGAAVTVTLDVASATVNSLTFTAMALANTLTHAGVNSLTVVNGATINQPTGAVTISWNVNAGSGVVNGGLSIGGANATASRVAQVAVTTGALSVLGSLSFASNTNAADEIISVTTGTITLNSTLAMSSGTLSMTGTGTINFNAGVTFGGVNTPVFSTVAGSNLNVGGNLNAVTTALALNGTSNTTFINNTTITPTVGITFGNIQINPGVTVTLGGNITVAGNWTDNGGTFSGGLNTVTLTGAAKTIGGAVLSTNFPAVIIASGATYTANINTICTGLTFAASSAASSLTQAAGLTVNGTVTINQPTAAATTSWSINAGTAVVNGDVLIGGTDLTSSRITQVAVTTGSLTVTGLVTYTSNASAATEVISVTTGTLTLNNALTLSSGTLLVSGAGTVNFNNGFNYGGVNNPIFLTAAGLNLNFGGNLTATTSMTLNGTSNTIFSNTSTITPTAAITFGNVQINSGVAVTLGGNITVAGNWTDNGGTLLGGANTVTLSGAAKTIGGVAATTNLPGVVVASGASYTANINTSCTGLTFAPSASASSLTQGAIVFTVNGPVTINQPTAAVTTSWNVNAGTAVANGDVLIGGSNATSSRVAQIAVTTGSLTVTGSLTYASNASAATEVVSLTTGSITLNNALSLSSGTVAVTGAGTINFNNGFNYGGVNNPIFLTAAGLNLNFGGNLTATTSMTLNGTSNTIFSNTSTITPTAAITFGNVQINSGVAVTLGGNITVAGNWTDNGGTLLGGANTVTLSGAAKTIGGVAATTNLPGVVVASGASYTANINTSCTGLTFAPSASASSLTQGAIVFTVNGPVTINQPTAAVTTSWNINTGTAVVNSDVLIGGGNTTFSRVAQIAVTTGSLTITGSLTYASNASAATEVVSLTTGSITLNNALSLSSGTVAVTGAGTINFNNGLTYGGLNNPVLSTAAGSNLNFGGNLTATTSMTLNGTSNTIFSNTLTITPTAAVTFGNVQINPGVTVTLGGNITVGGNWTNNGGTLLGGVTTVTLSGAAKTFGGTAATSFPGVLIASGASYTANTNFSCTGLVFAASSSASSLTQAAAIAVTVNGVVTINQPTAGVVTSWNVNAGTALVNGDVLIGGGNTTFSRVAQIAVTTGSLTITGSLTYASNTSPPTEVVSVTTGIITLSNFLTLSSGTLAITGAGTVNFNGGLLYGGPNNPLLSTIAGSILTFGGDLTAVNGLTLNGSSSTIFTNISTVTPTSPITFGNIQLNSGVLVTLGGNVTIAGNWTDNGGTFTGGINTVTLSGTGKTIGGTSGGTNLPAVVIGPGASYTANMNTSCTGLTFAASPAASALTQGAIVLTVNGVVTINQPTSSATTSWNINTGTAVVNGSILIGGISAASSRVAQIAVSSGSLTIAGSLTYAPNVSASTEIVTVSTGTVTLDSGLTLSSGTLAITGTGTVNAIGGLSFGGQNNPVLSTVAGSTLNMGGDLSTTVTPLTLNGTSNELFMNNSTITPAGGITFGNVQVNPGALVVLGGSIAVNGNLNLNLRSRLNPDSFSISLKGNFTTDGQLVSSSNTITLNGSAAQTVSGLRPPTFNNLVINNSSPSGVTLGEDATIAGALTLANGPLAIGVNTLTLNGVITKTGGTLIGGNLSNLVIGGSGPGSILPAVAINNLTVDRTAGIGLGGAVTVNGTLTLTDGILSIGTNTLILKGPVSIANGGLLGGNSSNLVITGTAPATTLPLVMLNNMTLNRNAGIGLSGNMTIAGVLTLTSGTITTGPNEVIIGPAGSVSRIAGYVAGKLQKNVAAGANVYRQFEIGDASNYTPVQASFNNVFMQGNLTASTTPGDHPAITGSGIVPSKSVNRYWTLSNDSTTFDSYGAKFNFVPGDIDPGANPNNFIVQKYDASAWSSPSTGARTSTSTQATGMTSFSDFALGEIASYTITASAGAGGSVSPSGVVGVQYGSTNIFTFLPNTGYHFDSLIVDGIKVDSTTSYTFSNIQGSHTINVKFAINSYIITATAGAGGAISPSGSVHVTYGADTVFRITPNPGYFIADLHVDTVSVGKISMYTFSHVSMNHTIDAQFYADTPPVGPGLLIPANGDTIQLYVTPQPTVFTWFKSSDVDIQDTLKYSIHIRGSGLDTTIAGLSDTSILLNVMARLALSSVYQWSVTVTDGFSTVASTDTFSFRTSNTTTGVHDISGELPTVYALDQNYPNPFNPSTNIQFALPSRSLVKLEIFNVTGQKIATLVDDEREAGFYTAKWDGAVSSGLYFYRIDAVSVSGKTNTFRQVKKMLFLK